MNFPNNNKITHVTAKATIFKLLFLNRIHHAFPTQLQKSDAIIYSSHYSKKMLGCFNPILGQIWTNPLHF